MAKLGDTSNSNRYIMVCSPVTNMVQINSVKDTSDNVKTLLLILVSQILHKSLRLLLVWSITLEIYTCLLMFVLGSTPDLRPPYSVIKQDMRQYDIVWTNINIHKPFSVEVEGVDLVHEVVADRVLDVVLLREQLDPRHAVIYAKMLSVIF